MRFIHYGRATAATISDKMESHFANVALPWATTCIAPQVVHVVIVVTVAAVVFIIVSCHNETLLLMWSLFMVAHF